MRFKKYTKWLMLGATVTVLAACSSTGGKDVPIDNLNGGDGSSGAGTKVTGLGHGSGFGGDAEASANGLHGSSLKVESQTYYFDFNKYDVHEADKPSIKVQADHLNKDSDAKLILEGHTDPRGSQEYNIALGEKRARAVLAVLEADGVNKEQIRVVSYGSEKALPGKTEEDYQKDRRVYLHYVNNN
jgi:peptidoglycan-associated lipoprotein